MTRLSVNLNEIAWLRNQREDGDASLSDAVRAILQAGAQGITLRFQADQRDVRAENIAEVAAVLADFNSPFPSFMMKEGETGDRGFTIEGTPSEKFLTLVEAHKCDAVTLICDELSDDIVRRLKKAVRKISVLIAPEVPLVEAAKEIGVDCVTFRTEREMGLKMYAKAGEKARELGLGICAGGNLHLDTLAKFIAVMPVMDEVCIGHAVINDALKMGWHGAVSAHLTAIRYGQQNKKAA